MRLGLGALVTDMARPAARGDGTDRWGEGAKHVTAAGIARRSVKQPAANRMLFIAPLYTSRIASFQDRGCACARK